MFFKSPFVNGVDTLILHELSPMASKRLLWQSVAQVCLQTGFDSELIEFRFRQNAEWRSALMSRSASVVDRLQNAI